MDIINRFDIYNGHFIEEAADIVESGGNRKSYVGCDKYQHLANNMNGWIAEHLFKATFPDGEFIDELEHDYLCADNAAEKYYRAGKPDFIKDNETAEVKAYRDEDKILDKINGGKNVSDKELHDATYVYILNGEDKNGYLLNRDSWTLTKVKYTARPYGYRGRVFYSF